MKAPEYYNGLKGRLTKQMVEDFMPINGDDSLIGVCGRKEIKGFVLFFIVYIINKTEVKIQYFFIFF